MMKSNLKTALRPVPLLLLATGIGAGLIACGSSSDGDVPSVSGQVVGSYYENAVVCLEGSTKLTCDSNSGTVRTGADGSFKVTGTNSGALLVTVGTDAIRHDALGDAGTKVTQKLVFRAPNGHTGIIDAISTELTAIMDANGGNFATASAQLAARIGVSEANLLADVNKVSGADQAKLKTENDNFTAVIAAAGTQSANADVANAISAGAALGNIKNIVVIYAENRGFDNLYGLFPGANGVPGVNPTSTSAYVPQKDIDNSTLPVLPPTWGGMTAAGQSLVITQAQTANLPNKPFQIDDANSPISMPQSVISRDLVHRFYNNQMQINGGANDKFAAYSDAGGLTMGYYDGSKMKMWDIAKQYALADNLFIGAFGGSFLTHQYLICACAPQYPNADTSVAAGSIAKIDLDSKGNFVRLTPSATAPTSVLNGAPAYANDGAITPADSTGMFYAVNTMQPPYQPSSNAPAGSDSSHLFADTTKSTTLPPQTQKNIGDMLTSKNVDWAWYSGAWASTTANATSATRGAFANPPNFQFHHQPFNYFANMDPVKNPTYRAAHLKDYDTQFVADAAAGTLPPVAFYKPQGNLNQHAGYASVADGDAHIANVIAQLKKSPQWKNMLVIVTYDENGGFFDHASPPKGDRWGPGTRVPAIIVSPYVKKGSVDHTQYDSASILRAITHRFNLPVLDGLTVRDKALAANGAKPMGDFSAALALTPQE
jgi:acid phosphatase